MLQDLMERTMSFDLELLLKAQLQASGPEALGQAGICWKDSEAESTSGDSGGEWGRTLGALILPALLRQTTPTTGGCSAWGICLR